MAGRIKQEPPKGFTPALALVDALPVLFFGISMLLAARRLQSGLFAVGAAVITLAGCGKVLWKLLLAVWKKNVPWLNRYFVPYQIAGSCLALAAILLSLGRIDWAGLVRFPRVIFWLLWLAGMGVMGWYRKHKFDNSLAANWTAQLINTATQGALLIAMLL